MEYQGENMLVIESKAQAGCRVLLNRADLIQLQYLEWSITETVVRKSTLIRPVALSQFQIIGDYIDREFTNVKSPPKNIDEMIIFIKNLRDDSVISNMPKNDVNLISQLKMYASSQLAEQWAQRWNREMSPDAADVDRGIDDFLRQNNPTQVTWAPTKGIHPVNTLLVIQFLLSSLSIAESQAEFSSAFKSFGVYEQYAFKQEDTPGDFNFCISIPFISYRISENKNANPLFENRTSPTPSAGLFTLPSIYFYEFPASASGAWPPTTDLTADEILWVNREDWKETQRGELMDQRPSEEQPATTRTVAS
ncbi:hypothetical protein QTP88_018938 [Uroleucon formosanum]